MGRREFGLVELSATCFDPFVGRLNKEIRNAGNPTSISLFETRSAPASLGAARCAFTFYLGNPISSVPDFLIKSISVSFVFFVVK
jgi:hypothetical protein